MDTQKFTPGPLFAREKETRMDGFDCILSMVENANGERICLCEKEEDAILYAAAPEMFARLTQVLPYLHKLIEAGHGDTVIPVSVVIKRIEDVIAKATASQEPTEPDYDNLARDYNDAIEDASQPTPYDP
ncbi:MAG: hypothetical protein LCH81_03550 [Bacteroidetes bacterium]|nr:hypothetical protein [Bacteroidota bacterium]